MLRLIKVALLLLPRIIWSYFTWINRYAKHPEKTPVSKRYEKVREFINAASRRLKIKPTVLGLENIPDNVCLFVSNHLAAADPLPFFYALEKPTAFVGKVEVKKMPVIGKVFAAGGGLFLNRSDLKQQLRVMMKVEDSLKKGEMSWVIFPEGTRNKDQMGRMLPFHHGTFRPAVKANVPIVPVAQVGCIRALHTKHSFKSYPTVIKFLKPIYPEEYQGKSTEEIALMVRNIIEKELDFSIKAIDHKQMSELKDPYYRFNKNY